jgi:integrase/recombinase XerD
MYCMQLSISEFSGTDSPNADEFAIFRDHLLDMKLSRSTINNYFFSIRKYHEMLGQDLSFKFIKPNNTIPYYFDETDIARIFGVCMNLKHLAMLKTMFYGSLRATELCNLDDSDIDLRALTIHVRCGKGGKDAIVFITDDCAKTLKRYLEVRAPLEVDGREPLLRLLGAPQCISHVHALQKARRNRKAWRRSCILST